MADTAKPCGLFVTLSSLGIVCDGTTDDGAAINAAITAHPGTWLDGEGLTCASSVNIMLRPNAWLRNFTVKDILPTRTNDRIITTAGGTTATNVKLKNITIDRNGPSTGGTANSGGFWLTNITDSTFENLEVHGDGQGKGFFLGDGTGSCVRNVVRDLTVENMRWSSATDPETEVIEGVRNSCSQSTYNNINIFNLTGAITGGGGCVQAPGPCPPTGTYFPYQIHCFISSGTNAGHVATDDIIDGLHISNCATAVDNSGSGTVQLMDYRNVHVNIAGDYGFKVAHDSRDVSCTGCTVSAAGTDAFYVEDGKSTDAVGPDDILCNDCHAINPGALYDYGAGTTNWWGASNHAGFHAAQVIGGKAMSNVRMNAITAIDNQGSHTMTYCLSRDDPSMDAQATGLKCSGAATAVARNFTFPNRLDDALSVGGAVSATSYSAGATAGVSCTGTLSASAVVTNGIVTHC